jgi:hypothetical protein
MAALAAALALALDCHVRHIPKSDRLIPVQPTIIAQMCWFVKAELSG